MDKKTEIALTKFIEDIKKKSTPKNLADQVQNLKIWLVANDKKKFEYSDIEKALKASEIKKILNHYKPKTPELLTIF